MKFTFYIYAVIGFIIWISTLGIVGSKGDLQYDIYEDILGVKFPAGTVTMYFNFKGWVFNKK